MPIRIAHVWTPDGTADHVVDGDWPDHLVLGRWIVRPEIDRDGRFLVTRGRHSGAEFLKYGSAREFSCEDVPALMEALGLDKEYRRGDRQQPDVDRSAREGEQRTAAPVARRERRRYFTGRGDGAQVQGR